MIGANAISAWAADLADLEDQIEALQDAKKEYYANLREEHGKVAANALKLAMKVHRMDSEKREDLEQIDTEAQRMLSIIEGSRAPRATRAHVETLEEFDVETGEITESHPGPDATGSSTPAAGPGGDEDRQPIPEVQPQDGGGTAEADKPKAAVTAGETAPNSEAVNLHAERIKAQFAQVKQTRKITFSDPAHPDCLDAERCGGFSNLKLCQRCAEAAAQGQVA